LFNTKTNTSVIIPMDHPVEEYYAELEDPTDLVMAMADAGANGFLMRRGSARLTVNAMNGAGWVQRITGRSGIAVAANAELDLDQLITASVEQALYNGADAVVPTVFFGGENEREILPVLGKISDECERFGIPLLAEVFPVGAPGTPAYNGPYTLDDMRVAVRIASEMGADFIKTWYSGDPESFAKIVAYSTVPVLIAGGPKANNVRDVLEMVKGAMDAGARGTTVGRKIWQSPDPAATVRAVSMIVHEGADVDTAMGAFS
jgi:DhnA family fructose-bisphosphate aldolase class Ia